MRAEYRTTVQPLWRNANSEHFHQADGIYHAPTAPLAAPEGGPWLLHSAMPLALIGEPKLICVWVHYLPPPFDAEKPR